MKTLLSQSTEVYTTATQNHRKWWYNFVRSWKNNDDLLFHFIIFFFILLTINVWIGKPLASSVATQTHPIYTMMAWQWLNENIGCLWLYNTTGTTRNYLWVSILIMTWVYAVDCHRMRCKLVVYCVTALHCHCWKNCIFIIF